MRVRGSLSPPHSHAWFPYATTSNYARRRCAIGPRRTAVFIGHAYCFYRFDSFRANNDLYNTTSMKTAIRLGPIAHLRRAKCIGNISNNQAWEWGGDKLPLTLIPGYLISPLTGWGWRVRLLDISIKNRTWLYSVCRYLNEKSNIVILCKGIFEWVMFKK